MTEYIQVCTTPLSPAIEEAIRFRNIVLWGIGILLCFDILLIGLTK